MSDALVVGEDDVERDAWSDPIRCEVGFQSLFGGALRTSDFNSGVTELEVGGWLGHHRHVPSEINYVLGGEGSLSIDGRDHQVRVRVLPHRSATASRWQPVGRATERHADDAVHPLGDTRVMPSG